MDGVSDVVGFYADVKPKLSIFQAVIRYPNNR